MYIYLDIFPAEKSIGFELEDLHTLLLEKMEGKAFINLKMSVNPDLRSYSCK